MPKKTIKVQCIIFSKPKVKKEDVIRWCKNHKEMTSVCKSLRSSIKKLDKDFILVLRKKSKFKKISTQKKGMAKIKKGYLI